MTKLYLPEKEISKGSVDFQNYKGFIFRIEEMKEGGLWVGAATAEDHPEISFKARGSSENKVGQQLMFYIDMFRKKYIKKEIMS